MRLAGQIKGGYYPLHPEAVRTIARQFVPPESPAAMRILDPCAGEGEALWALREAIGCPIENTYAVELNAARGEQCRQRGLKHVLAPCSAFDSILGTAAYSLMYLNPPFDVELDGGRTEVKWLKYLTNRLTVGGVLMLVVPEKVATSEALRQMVYCNYSRVSLHIVPPEFARYREWIILGERRSSPRPWTRSSFEAEVTANRNAAYHIKPSRGPERFEKTGLTDDELFAAVARSPLQAMLSPPPERRRPSPPMPLGIGHLAILLAAGHLDGIVRPLGEEPHVVRGSAAKEAHITDVSEETANNGTVTEKITTTERIKLVVRTVNGRGELATYTSDD